LPGFYLEPGSVMNRVFLLSYHSRESGNPINRNPYARCQKSEIRNHTAARYLRFAPGCKISKFPISNFQLYPIPLFHHFAISPFAFPVAFHNPFCLPAPEILASQAATKMIMLTIISMVILIFELFAIAAYNCRFWSHFWSCGD
jgi:hypothetical protein